MRAEPEQDNPERNEYLELVWRQSLEKLPPEAFVWLDEFEKWYVESYYAPDTTWREQVRVVGEDEDPEPIFEPNRLGAMDLNPIVMSDMLPMIRAGFEMEHYKTVRSECDAPANTVATVTDIVAAEGTPGVPDVVPKIGAKRTSAFKDVLPYLQEVFRNGKFKTTDEYIRELVKQTGSDVSPFKKSLMADSCFLLKEKGRSVSHSVIADKMKDIR
jgi:hypothetical protein